MNKLNLSKETVDILGSDLVNRMQALTVRSITLKEATIIQDLKLAIGKDALSPRTITILSNDQDINITDTEAFNIAMYMRDELI